MPIQQTIEILKLNNQSLLGTENICTKEHLTKVMAPLASRATIINFINDQIAIGSLQTEISKFDKKQIQQNHNKNIFYFYKTCLKTMGLSILNFKIDFLLNFHVLFII